MTRTLSSKLEEIKAQKNTLKKNSLEATFFKLLRIPPILAAQRSDQCFKRLMNSAIQSSRS